MTPERWRRIDGVVQSVLDADPAVRRERLREVCGDDRELLEEAAGLLAADDLAGDFLAAPCALAAPTGTEGDGAVTPIPDGLAPGKRIGSYRLLHPIGHGGMGVVYLAERADGSFEQRVAVKIVRRDLDPGAIESRFRAERQILAGLDHPAIARLLDGGSTDDGYPYLVMEHVEGSPIDEYCDRHRLDVRARIDLFLRVCAAVRYAHQNLVVHRDLKPTNVLVTEDGTPKLLDFGVAKLLEPSVSPVRVETTLTGHRALTPSYASPEQLTGRRVTTASDVYSLGVILYRLLTGGLPRRFSGLLPADVGEMLREPTRPSQAVQEGEEPAARIAESRSASLPQLARLLRGDLDNIVLEALRSDPERRYPSVAAIEEDLHRHLTGRPVRARPPSWSYTAGKFLRRNRIAAAATAAFLVLLLAFAGTMALQRGRLAEERDRAAAAREQAQFEQEKAEEIADLMVGLFDEVSPEQARGREVTVREVLDRRAEALAEEFEDQPELLATLKAKMGEVYRRIGAYPEARALLEEAKEIREEVLGPTDPLVAETLSDLAAVYRTEADLPGAELLLERSVAIFRRAGPPAAAGLVPTLERLSIVRSLMGDAEGSEALSREILALQERRFGEASAEVAHALSDLAVHRYRRGELEAALELYRRVLAVQERVLPEDHPDRLDTLHNLGELYGVLGRYPEARRHLHRSLVLTERVLGPDHDDLAITAHALAEVHRLTGDLDGAEELYRRALGILERAFGAGHPRTADLQHSLGQLALDHGRLAEAERLYRRALDLHRRAPAPFGPQVIDDLTGIGMATLQAGSLDEARRALQEAVSAARDLPPTPALQSALARAFLAQGELHEARGDVRAAASSWRRVVELTDGALPAFADRETRAEALRRLENLG